MSWFKHVKYAQLKSFVYSMPKDPEQRLYDFYLMTLLGETGNPYLDSALQESKSILLRRLKKHLLNVVFYSLTAEFRHAFDEAETELIKDFVKQDEDWNKIFESYENKLVRADNPAASLPEGARSQEKRLQEEEMTYSYKQSYNSMLHALKNNNISKVDAVKMMKDTFNQENFWSRSYGGESWGQIADGWLKLYNAKTEGELITFIDHVYDLQHNNGTIFSKLQSYQKPSENNEGFEWIKQALDYKANITSPYDILSKASRSLRKLANYVLHANYGTTEEQYYEENEKQIKEHWLQSLKDNPEIFGSFPPEIQQMFTKQDLKKVWFKYMASEGLNELQRIYENKVIPEEIRKIITKEEWKEIWKIYFETSPASRWKYMPEEIKKLFTDEEVLTSFVNHSRYNSEFWNHRYDSLPEDIKEKFDKNPEFVGKAWAKPLVAQRFSAWINNKIPEQYKKEPYIKFIAEELKKEIPGFPNTFRLYLPEKLKKYISEKDIIHGLDEFIKKNYKQYQSLGENAQKLLSKETMDFVMEKYLEEVKLGYMGFGGIPLHLLSLIPKEILKQTALEILSERRYEWFSMPFHIKELLPKNTLKIIVCRLVEDLISGGITWSEIIPNMINFINVDKVNQAIERKKQTGIRPPCNELLNLGEVEKEIIQTYSPGYISSPPRLPPPSIPEQEQQEKIQPVVEQPVDTTQAIQEMKDTQDYLVGLEKKKNELV